jgi:hypothetical protein
MQFVHDLIHVHKVAPIEKGVGDVQFAARQVAMFSAGHWPVPTLLSGGLRNVGVQAVPNKRKKTTVFGVGGLGITHASKNPELAWELIKELTGPAAQKMYADTNRNIPALRSAASSPAFVKYPSNAGMFYATAATAVPIASPSNFSEVEDIFMRNVELYLTNNTTLDAMLTASRRVDAPCGVRNRSAMSRLERKEQLAACAFAPTFLFYLLFAIIPLGHDRVLFFHDQAHPVASRVRRSGQFAYVYSDPRFWTTFRNTLFHFAGGDRQRRRRTCTRAPAKPNPPRHLLLYFRLATSSRCWSRPPSCRTPGSFSRLRSRGDQLLSARGRPAWGALALMQP